MSLPNSMAGATSVTEKTRREPSDGRGVEAGALALWPKPPKLKLRKISPEELAFSSEEGLLRHWLLAVALPEDLRPANTSKTSMSIAEQGKSILERDREWVKNVHKNKNVLEQYVRVLDLKVLDLRRVADLRISSAVVNIRTLFEYSCIDNDLHICPWEALRTSTMLLASTLLQFREAFHNSITIMDFANIAGGLHKVDAAIKHRMLPGRVARSVASSNPQPPASQFFLDNEKAEQNFQMQLLCILHLGKEDHKHDLHPICSSEPAFDDLDDMATLVDTRLTKVFWLQDPSSKVHRLQRQLNFVYNGIKHTAELRNKVEWLAAKKDVDEQDWWLNKKKSDLVYVTEDVIACHEQKRRRVLVEDLKDATQKCNKQEGWYRGAQDTLNHVELNEFLCDWLDKWMREGKMPCLTDEEKKTRIDQIFLLYLWRLG
ncbi:unnamed protein product [Amoebophrya sp. A25]|nr:unnamed protein product [Amoebophrya sp. A25]|eukprot:GSA25T00008110001.1